MNLNDVQIDAPETEAFEFTMPEDVTPTSDEETQESTETVNEEKVILQLKIKQ